MSGGGGVGFWDFWEALTSRANIQAPTDVCPWRPTCAPPLPTDVRAPLATDVRAPLPVDVRARCPRCRRRQHAPRARGAVCHGAHERSCTPVSTTNPVASMHAC
eukprot:365274-Chlamydomonas_euryale.AAC.7